MTIEKLIKNTTKKRTKNKIGQHCHRQDRNLPLNSADPDDTLIIAVPLSSCPPCQITKCL